MTKKANRRRPMSEINVVPYIDVMLVLLVIFMVTAPLMNQGIEVNLPEALSDALEAGDQEILVVTIKADGTYYMNSGEEETAVPLATIRDRAGKILAANPDISVLVEGDRELKYGTVVGLMNILQSAGARNVGLVTDPPAS